MSDNSVSAGWTNTDDDAAPVRVSSPEKLPNQEKAEPVAVAATEQAAPQIHQKRPEASVAPNPGAMRWSAFTGIAVVVVLGTLYLGIDNLRGSLTEGSGSSVTVTITEDNHFSPTEVRVTAGGTLTFENKNKDPQVIKVKEGNELFPTQVLFEKPYVFVVPTDTQGIFTYVSETLPDGEQVMITVTPAIEAAAALEGTQETSSLPPIDTSSLPPIEDMNDFPLPFGGAVEVEPQSAPETPVIETSVEVAPQEPPRIEERHAATVHDSNPEDISVGSEGSSEAATFDSGAIPTNPFTVGTAKDRGNRGSEIARAEKNLHQGAPLLQMRSRPRANTETGNELWLALIPTLVLMTLAYRRMVAA